MDLALFFVLPLIGGFAFATTFDLLRYRTGREDSQRLYYRAALIGVLLAAGGATLHVVLARLPAYATGIRGLSAQLVVPLLEKERGAGTTALSQTAQDLRIEAVLACLYGFVLGVLTPIWNLVIRLADALWTRLPFLPPRASFLDRLNLNAITDQLERLIAESLAGKTLVQVTLSNSKVYVGSVHESLNPASPAKYFKLQPWLSGYRSSKDGRVDFNTYYDTVLASLETSDAASEVAASFQLVIPIDKVVSASGFSLEAYEKFELDRLDRDDREKERAAAETATPASPAVGPVAAAAAVLIGWWLARKRQE